MTESYDCGYCLDGDILKGFDPGEWQGEPVIDCDTGKVLIDRGSGDEVYIDWMLRDREQSRQDGACIKIYPYVYDENGWGGEAEINIRYCPFCGRKLEVDDA